MTLQATLINFTLRITRALSFSFVLAKLKEIPLSASQLQPEIYERRVA